jgi:hypothetical protein
MKKLITTIAILLFSGAVYAQAPTQTPLTQAQIEEALQQVRIEKRYLELQVKEQILVQALENMKKGKDAPKPEAKKEPKK